MTEETGRRQLIVRIALFAVIMTVLAWLAPALGGDPVNPGLGFLIWAIAPIGTCVLLRAILRDWSDWGARLNANGNGRWYALSILIYPVAILIVLLLGLLFGASEATPGVAVGDLLGAMIPNLVLYLFFAMFEEIGWRGYLAPKVYKLGLNGLLAHAIVGVIWASWHLPYIRELNAHTSASMASVIPRFFIGAIAFSLVYGEIRIRIRSFWPAVLMHWVGNVVANTLIAGYRGQGLVRMVAGREYIGSFGVEGLLMILIFGAVGLALYRQRIRGDSAS